MEEWRFLEVDWLTYADTAIYRPVLMRSVGEGIAPNTVTFFRFPKPSMIITFFNDPEKEINLDFCRKRGIPVHRLIIGGGPIFGDTGYVITFLHLSRNTPGLPPNVENMLEKTLTGVAAGISERFNVECRFRPINDVEIKCQNNIWKKIGPSGCIYEEKAIQMTSGIQVKENDVDLIAQIIAASKEKFHDKETKSIQERITYLEKVVERTIDLNEVRNVFIGQIEKLFDVKLVLGELTEEEKTYYQEMKEEYTSEDFFMERSERKFGTVPLDVIKKKVQFKVPEGPFVRIITLVKGDTLWDILISGTIHASPLRPTSPIHEIERALKGQTIDKKLFESKIEEILNRPNFTFAKVSPELLADKIYECASQPYSSMTS